ncbi:MAG: hypothetical protein K6D94_03155 [Clostridiales bacterium]|nr:hypothetical protein [Clostridiales bacterium]
MHKGSDNIPLFKDQVDSIKALDTEDKITIMESYFSYVGYGRKPKKTGNKYLDCIIATWCGGWDRYREKQEKGREYASRRSRSVRKEDLPAASDEDEGSDEAGDVGEETDEAADDDTGEDIDEETDEDIDEESDEDIDGEDDENTDGHIEEYTIPVSRETDEDRDAAEENADFENTGEKSRMMSSEGTLRHPEGTLYTNTDTYTSTSTDTSTDTSTTTFTLSLTNSPSPGMAEDDAPGCAPAVSGGGGGEAREKEKRGSGPGEGETQEHVSPGDARRY